MAAFTLRPATEADSPGIKRLIHDVGINPMSLDWHRFIVAVDAADRLLGCGQIKPHGKEIIELASIAVQPDQRGRGIARALIEQLLTGATRPVYLICRSQLGPFYQKWGFRALLPREMPPYYRRLARIAGIFSPLAGEGGGVLVMELM